MDMKNPPHPGELIGDTLEEIEQAVDRSNRWQGRLPVHFIQHRLRLPFVNRFNSMCIDDYVHYFLRLWPLHLFLPDIAYPFDFHSGALILFFPCYS